MSKLSINSIKSNLELAAISGSLFLSPQAKTFLQNPDGDPITFGEYLTYCGSCIGIGLLVFGAIVIRNRVVDWKKPREYEQLTPIQPSKWLAAAAEQEKQTPKTLPKNYFQTRHKYRQLKKQYGLQYKAENFNSPALKEEYDRLYHFLLIS
ncbi:hypothetical protein A3A74_03030 [Candidatus Roizmanbacteria bacterium RIFCSPLOWO2_01_FULL_35_13]|uniref:Uncharacterized protein n=1 Tax=Candidatus Roizmanbacteria bacterium RIFCSPLOWO2_01_FULL_35_13 TaxID=1802055 RepID=A0A1F7I914_9BACT|nr:MAG: hypothetical protein A3A74_03030 [Candidatus Roizmanbacteria bacterium RIFCSPLOWO2_01_FULL_35_13]